MSRGVPSVNSFPLWDGGTYISPMSRDPRWLYHRNHTSDYDTRLNAFYHFRLSRLARTTLSIASIPESGLRQGPRAPIETTLSPTPDTSRIDPVDPARSHSRTLSVPPAPSNSYAARRWRARAAGVSPFPRFRIPYARTTYSVAHRRTTHDTTSTSNSRRPAGIDADDASQATSRCQLTGFLYDLAATRAVV